MILNIYDKKEVIKTYEAEQYDLMFGTVEDLMTIFDVDSLKTGSDVELIKLVSNSLPKCMNIIKPLLKDIFDGLSDDELRQVKLVEVAVIIVDVIKYALEQISTGFGSKK